MKENNTRELSDSEKIDWLIKELTMIKAIVLDRFDSVDGHLNELESTIEEALSQMKDQTSKIE